MVQKLKKIELLNINESYLKVLYWFFSFPQMNIGLNELSEKLKISKTTAKKVVLKLVKEDFLRIEVIGKAWKISCNQDHPYNTTLKIPYNLNLISNSGILDTINDMIPNSLSIILFGSYRKGDDTEKSDIDIAVEVLGDEEMKITELGVLPKLGNRKNVSVNLHIFSRKKIDLNLFSNIANGIVLQGFLEVRP